MTHDDPKSARLVETSDGPVYQVDTNSRAITRRTLLGGASAALAGARVESRQRIGANKDDEELLALRPLWQQALADFESILAAKRPIEIRAFARMPVYPARKDFTSDEAYAAAREQVDDVFLKIQAEEGLTDIERREEDVLDTYHAVVDRIVTIRARTVTGLLFKAEVSAGFEHAHETLPRSIVEDLLALYE